MSKESQDTCPFLGFPSGPTFHDYPLSKGSSFKDLNPNPMTSRIRAFYSQRQDEAQERPQPTLPHDTERFVAARSQATTSKKRPTPGDFGNLLLGSFASGKSSAVKASSWTQNNFCLCMYLYDVSCSFHSRHHHVSQNCSQVI